MSFPRPQSRNEAILQNILGASNQLEPPQSRMEALLLQLLDQMKDVTHYIGVTTTPLEDGSTTNPVMINGESVTAEGGDWVFYQGGEYAWNGSAWGKFGDLADLIAAAVSYDNTESELTAENVQAALDEIVTKLPAELTAAQKTTIKEMLD